MISSTFILYSFPVILALMVLDVVTTMACLQTGQLREGNPIMKRIATDPRRSLLVKLAAALSIVMSSWYFQEIPFIPIFTIVLTIILYSATVMNNLVRYMKVRYPRVQKP